MYIVYGWMFNGSHGSLLVIVGTGTGKTLSFVLPLLERMSVDGLVRSERGRPPCTLVMAPTRELANQVRGRKLEDMSWFKCSGFVH